MKYEIEQTHQFENWITGKKVKPFVGRFLSRLERVKHGNFGDHKQISSQLFELRFFFGSGLRIYYTVRDNRIIFLLVGGDKSSQSSDIEKANQLIQGLE